MHGPMNVKFFIFFFFFFRWRYSPLWALACRTIPLHFSLSITNSLHLLTASTWRSLSLHPFLGLPFRLVPSSSWVKMVLGILSSSLSLSLSHTHTHTYTYTHTHTRAVRKVSSHFEYLENRSCSLDVTWQQVGRDLTVHPWTITLQWG